MKLTLLFIALMCFFGNLDGKPIKHKCFNSDPEESMEALEIIHRWGYPGEEHNVTTDDGYILRIQRIPHGKGDKGNGTRPIIFMQHGLLCSSTNWITNLPNQSAAFLFADAGFDVWLGNIRGNTYGMKNLYTSKSEHKFWEFSWDDMATHDINATINYALNISNASQLYYMGHSMGTMMAFARFSDDLDFGKKIIKFFALSPIATLENIGGAFSVIAPYTRAVQIFTSIVGVDEFLPSNWFMDLIARYVCGWTITNKLLCENIMFLIAGPNSDQLNQTRTPVYVSHAPAGTSTQNIVHFGQQVNSGLFQKYNYGSARANQAKYGKLHPTPPVYNVSNMIVPTALFFGDNDVLADPTDVKNTLNPGVQNLIAVCELADFNHLDFIWGLKASQAIYWKIINHIKNGKDLC